MRSSDMLCGVPLNIIHISLLTRIFAKMLGYKAGTFTFQAANTHVYKNHIQDALIQIEREPYEFPTVEIKKEIKTIEDIENLKFEDFVLNDYKCHSPIKYEMAV